MNEAAHPAARLRAESFGLSHAGGRFSFAIYPIRT
jgi:hypothetical protein